MLPKTASPGAARGRLAEFDVLRALAITLLIFHHGGIYNFSFFGLSLQGLNDYLELLLLGSFVFMSGYFSAASLEKHSLLSFLKTRLARIYLPYLAALGLFVVLLEVDVSSLDLVIHLFGGQMLLSPHFTSPILTLWYIGLILAYHVLFGLLYKLIRSPVKLLVALLVVFGLLYLVRLEWALVARRFFYYYWIFAAGLITARQGWLRRLETRRYFYLDKLLLLAAGAALFAPFQEQFGQGVGLPLIAAMSAYTLAAVLFVLSAARLLVPWAGRSRLVRAVSYASFFAYLIHRPVWALLMAIYRPAALPQLSAYLILVGGSSALALAYLLQRLYDRAASRLKLV